MIRVRRKEQGEHGAYGADLVHSEDDSGLGHNQSSQKTPINPKQFAAVAVRTINVKMQVALGRTTIRAWFRSSPLKQ